MKNGDISRTIFSSLLFLAVLIPAQSSVRAGERAVLNHQQRSQFSISGNHNMMPSWTASGETGYSYFGLSVASAGDVNKDGYSDVVIGEPGHTSQAAYVYAGSANGFSNTPIWAVGNQIEKSEFGYTVSSAGDVNKDGYSDIVVGDWLDNDGIGRAFVYLGSATGPKNTPDWTSAGDGIYTYFGYWVSNAGDVNGDGYSDVVIRAFGKYTDTGKVYVYFGGAGGLSVTPDWVMAGEAESGDHFGTSVTGAGDINGDGYDDLVIGAPYARQYAGMVYVYLGSAAGLSATPVWTATGEARENHFGESVASAGDVNGDGFGDLVIGAPYASQEGKAYVYFGSANGLSVKPNWTAAGGLDNQEFGISVASAGDVNHDGFSDLVIGTSTSYTFFGEAHIYLGSARGLFAPLTGTATGEANGDHFGNSVAGAGDVNGDGYSDIVVGAYGYNDHAGKVYAYYGAPIDTSSPYTLHLTIVDKR